MTQAKFTGVLYVKEFTKAERKASRAQRAADRPAKRAARKAHRAEQRLEKQIAATLREDRKRSFLATYTEGVRQARALKKTLRESAKATAPAEAESNETR